MISNLIVSLLLLIYWFEEECHGVDLNVSPCWYEEDCRPVCLKRGVPCCSEEEGRAHHGITSVLCVICISIALS